MTSTAAGARPSPGSSRMPASGRSASRATADRAQRQRPAPPRPRGRGPGPGSAAPRRSTPASGRRPVSAAPAASRRAPRRPARPRRRRCRGRSGSAGPGPRPRRPASRAPAARVAVSSRGSAVARERLGRGGPGVGPQVGLELDRRGCGGCPAPARSRGSSLPWAAKKLSAGTTRVGGPVPAPGKASTRPCTSRRTGSFSVSTVTVEPTSRSRSPTAPTSSTGTGAETPLRRVAAAVAASAVGQRRQQGAAGRDRSTR